MSEGIKKKISAHFKDARKKLVAAEKKASAYVRSHPEKAVGIAAAVGAAVGAAIATGIAIAHKRYKDKKK